MRGADLSVIVSPASGRAGVGRENRDRRLASLIATRRLVGPVDVAVVSLELKRDSWPWVYEKSDKPPLLISTLEALAVLFSLMLFFDDIQPDPRWRPLGRTTAAMGQRSTS